MQITLASRGPAVRAEASAENFYAALDAAVTKLETRLRRSADRRHDRQHGRTPIAAVAAIARGDPRGRASRRPNGAVGAPQCSRTSARRSAADDERGRTTDRWVAPSDGGPGRIVRIKDHPADPITVDQALFQMELVGHDFYLFNDADTGCRSVVYRRKGFDYGLLRLT